MKIFNLNLNNHQELIKSDDPIYYVTNGQLHFTYSYSSFLSSRNQYVFIKGTQSRKYFNIKMFYGK